MRVGGSAYVDGAPGVRFALDLIRSQRGSVQPSHGSGSSPEHKARLMQSASVPCKPVRRGDQLVENAWL
jgi:hypothetical protein